MWDLDKVKDELIGSLKFSLKEIIKATKEAPVYKWVSVYGAPLGVSGETTDKMNACPEFASTWKGRILIMYYAEDTKNPTMKIKEMTEEQIREAKDYERQTEFGIICEVGTGICLPNEKKY